GDGVEPLPPRPRRLLHLRGRHGGRLRRPARSDRLQAGRDGRERRLGGDGVRVPGDRDPARSGGRTAMGAGAGAGGLLAAGGGGGSTTAAALESIDLPTTTVRDLNQRLHDAAGAGPSQWRIENPEGAHALAAGLDGELEVEINGHVGYYCAGMNKLATVLVAGNCGVGVAENMMSGLVV